MQGDADVSHLLGYPAAHRHLDDGDGDLLEGRATVDETIPTSLDADSTSPVGQGDAGTGAQAYGLRVKGDEVVG